MKMIEFRDFQDCVNYAVSYYVIQPENKVNDEIDYRFVEADVYMFLVDQMRNEENFEEFDRYIQNEYLEDFNDACDECEKIKMWFKEVA